MSSYNRPENVPPSDHMPPQTAAYYNTGYQMPYQQVPAPIAAASDPPRYEVHHHDGNNDNNNDVDDDNSIPERHLNVEFSACFKEQKSSVKTIPPIYKAYGIVYKYTQYIFYNTLVIIFGIPLAILWAIMLGFLAFVISWLYNPVLKMTLLVINSTLPIIVEPLKALFTPLIDVLARVFKQIKIDATLGGGLLAPLARDTHVAEHRV